MTTAGLKASPGDVTVENMGLTQQPAARGRS
jgi:hypothetical protein